MSDDSRPNTAPADMMKSQSTGTLRPLSSSGFLPQPGFIDADRPPSAPCGGMGPGIQPNLRKTTTMGSRWLMQQSKEQIRIRSEAEAAERKSNKGAKSFEDLKKILTARYGSIYSAWRQAL